MESVRNFFGRLSSGKGKKPRVKPPKREKPATKTPAKTTAKTPAKVEKPKKPVTETTAPVDKAPARSVPGGLASPWPEHKIRFDPAVIDAKGFVSSEQETLGGVHGYRFYKADGSSQFIRAEMAIVQRMAQRV